MRTPRHSTVVAYLALFVALGGSAVAVTKIGPKQLKKNAVRSKHIKNKAVRLTDISVSARTALKGQAGAKGDKGDPGAQGPPGSSVSAADTVFVPASGTPAENGTALRDALGALPAATKDDPLAVQLGAGRYDLAGTGAAVPADVTLAGAGRDATIVDSAPNNVKLTLLDLGERAGLRDLTVRTASAALGSTGVHADGDNLLESIHVFAGIGVEQAGGQIRDSLIEGSSVGVRVFAASPQTIFELLDSRVRVFAQNAGKAFHASDFFSIRDSVIGVAAAGGNGDAVFYDGGAGRQFITNSSIEATSGATARGVAAQGIGGQPTIMIDASQIDATTALNAVNATLEVGGSLVDGNSVTGAGGVVSCAPGVYDDSQNAVDCDAP